MHGMYKK